MPLSCSQQLLSKVPCQIFLYYQEVQVLNSLGSSIHSALVIRLQVEIRMICQGKIIVICNQQYQVYESCSSCFTFTNTTLTKLFACGKPIKIIQICKMPGKQNFYKLFCCFKKHELSQKRLGLHIEISSSSQHPYKN